MTNALSKSVVFIKGTFISSNGCDEWNPYFESKGYNSKGSAWPYKDAAPEELRNRHSDPAIAPNRLVGLSDYFADAMNELPEKPSMIGHSIGSLVVQLLLQRGLSPAGVAIHSFPPPGINAFRLSFIKAVGEAMAFFISAKAIYLVSFQKCKGFFVNGLHCEQGKQLYYKYAYLGKSDCP